MSVKILGGKLKGISLEVPASTTIRPTSVMLKRKIFDYCQKFERVLFVDGCCGTGSIAFEAWSRGAQEVYCVESDRFIFDNLRKNLGKISKNNQKELEERRINLVNSSIEEWVDRDFGRIVLNNNKINSKTIFFLDPPYSMLDLYKKVICSLAKTGVLVELWVESDKFVGLRVEDLEALGCKFDKVFSQGSKFIAISYESHRRS